MCGSKDSVNGVGIAFLLGAVVGAAVGVFYAPHSGKITRGLVDEKLHEAKRKAEKIIDDAKDEADIILRGAI